MPLNYILKLILFLIKSLKLRGLVKIETLELFFLQDNAFKMMILLPDTVCDLLNLENNISEIKFHEIISKMEKCDVIVKMPHFKLKQTTNMKELLSNVRHI